MNENEIRELKSRIAAEVAKIDGILGAAQTGDINAPLIAGKSDVDIFVICDEIPAEDRRLKAYEKFPELEGKPFMNASNGGLWGWGDILSAGGIGIMFMFFTEKEMREYLTEILEGKHLDCVGGFYPTGRLASIETISVLSEKDGAWTKLKALVADKPAALFRELFYRNIYSALDDEDIGRAVMRRDILFFHWVTEKAADCLLQALFAINETYFPSRKRTKQYTDGFKLIPEDFLGRLTEALRLSVKEDEIENAGSILLKLVAEVKQIGEKKFN